MLVYSRYEDGGFEVLFNKHSKLMGNADLVAAFTDNDTLTISVRVPRTLCAASAFLRLYRDDDMSVSEIEAPLSEFGDSEDIFSVEIILGDRCIDGKSGLFYYTFGLETPYGILYTARDGSLTPNLARVSCLQLTVYKKEMKIPENFAGSMMYQIFVDRFYDGGRYIAPSEGKVRNPDWKNGTPKYPEKPGDAFDNNEFFGGNLWGVAAKLDYIASLGVDTLYLCPIFEAASNHKYDTGDYEKVDRMFGGDEALRYLVAECKARKMKLILDGVFNHTGADSRYFNKFGTYGDGGAFNRKESPFYEWYRFEEYPNKYRSWWGVDILPSVDSTNASYREYICGENGIIRRYLRMGIDGWRLDVADELSDVFLEDLKRAARAENPDALIIGEVWEDASNKISYGKRRRYFRGDQLDSVMNYPLKEAITDYIMTADSTRLAETARELWAHYPTDVSRVLMNFLGTHDTERILTVLSGVDTASMTNAELAVYRMPADVRELAQKRLKLAFTLLAAFPGIPCIYYGDEAGMEGGRDPFNRCPFVWGREDTELTDHYRKIGAVRHSEPLFAMGNLRIEDTDDRSHFLMIREHKGRRLAVAVNLSDEKWNLNFSGDYRRLLDNKVDTSVEAMGAEYFVCD